MSLITEKIENITKNFVDSFKSLEPSLLKFNDLEVIRKKLAALVTG